MPLMMTAAATRSFRVLATRPIGTSPVRGLWLRSVGPPSISGMTETPVSKPLRPRASFGNTSTAPADQQGDIALHRERGAPVGEQRRLRDDLHRAAGEDDEVEEEIGHRGEGGEADGLVEPPQEHCREHGEDREGDEDLVLAEHGMEERILDGVLGGVGGRQRHRDDEVGSREAQQDEDEPLALPAAEQVLQHGNGALPGIAALRHLRVDGEGAEQRDEDEDHRRDRRHRARREQRDAGLVAEGREVVDAGQPDDLPPGIPADHLAGVLVHGLAAPQPLPHGGPVLERGLSQLLAKGDAASARGSAGAAIGSAGVSGWSGIRGPSQALHSPLLRRLCRHARLLPRRCQHPGCRHRSRSST